MLGEFPALSLAIANKNETNIVTLTDSNGHTSKSIQERILLCEFSPSTKSGHAGYWATQVYGNKRSQSWDIKQYAKYMATKFVFEPEVLQKGGGYFTSQNAGEISIFEQITENSMIIAYC